MLGRKHLDRCRWGGIDPPAPLNAVTAAQIFSADKGKGFSAELENGFIVGQVTEVTLPETRATGKDLEEMNDVVGKSFGTDMFAQFVTELTEGKKIKINQPRLEQLYKQQIPTGE